MASRSLTSAAGARWEISAATASPMASPPATGWLPATVPGNVQADLEDARRLAPLRYGSGDPRLHDVADHSWWYRTTFDTVPAPRTTIVFDGVDFSCDVYVNGAHVGSSAGTFRRFRIDISDAIHTEGTNELYVLVHRMPEALRATMRGSDGAQSGAETEHFFVFSNNQIRRTLGDLKSPATTSYDWGTNVWALGIWRDVEVTTTGPARIDWTRIITRLTDDYSSATVRVDVDIDSTRTVDARLAVDIVGPDTAPVRATVAVHVPTGASRVCAEVTLDDPKLWWPRGHGEQHLYTAETRLFDGDVLLDENHTRFGLREIRWGQVDGASEDFVNPFALYVNGRRIRTMGSNIVSPDLLFGRNGRTGAWVMHAAAAANVTTLRLHGGGVTLPPVMYDAADELGLLILQEFPMGNCRPESDERFLTNLRATATSIVRQLRNHPSIVEWGGGNELHWVQNEDAPALRVLADVVRVEDDRIFRATCPMQGSRHSPWYHNHAYSYAHYSDESMTDNIGSSPLMRYGEFGTQTPANIEVWMSDMPPGSRWPIDSRDDPVLVRKNATQAVFSDEHWLTLPLIEELFGVSRDLQSMIRAGQFLGAEGLRFAVDALRRRGGRLGGFTTWDFNEPWPNAAGSYVIDYDGRPLMNYDFLAQSLDPIGFCVAYTDMLYDPRKPIDVDIAVVSDAAAPAHDLRWSWTARDRRGTAFAHGAGTIAHLTPLEVVELPGIALTPPAATAYGPVLLELQLTASDGSVLSERVHLFGAAGIRAPLRPLLATGESDADDTSAPVRQPGNPATPDNLAWSSNGARIAEISGVECRDEDPVRGLIDGRYCTARDGFGSGAVWQSTTPRGYFVIELADPAEIGRIVFGRDRSGTHHDRTVDELVIEVSVDAVEWTTVCAETRLAARLGDRVTPGHVRSNPGAVNEFAPLAAYRPTWSLEITIPPTMARYVRVTAQGRPGERRYVAFDEIEVYRPDGTEPGVRVIDHEELDRYVAPARIAVTDTRLYRDGGWETLRFDVRNTGKMTALFCVPRPLLDDRTDLLFGNRDVSIPPGQARTLTVRTKIRPGALTLSQLGWQVSAWNAQPAVVVPDVWVVAALGRRDGTTNDRDVIIGQAEPATLTRTGEALRIPLKMPDDVAGLRVRLHAADVAAGAPAILEVSYRDWATTVQLAAGLGVQLDDPDHLAYGDSGVVDIPSEATSGGDAELRVQLVSGAWVSWDAIHVVAIPAGTHH